jgi:hypothetical protein
MQKEGRRPFCLDWARPCLAKPCFAFGFEFINLMGKYKKAGQEFFSPPYYFLSLLSPYPIIVYI